MITELLAGISDKPFLGPFAFHWGIPETQWLRHSKPSGASGLSLGGDIGEVPVKEFHVLAEVSLVNSLPQEDPSA